MQRAEGHVSAQRNAAGEQERLGAVLNKRADERRCSRVRSNSSVRGRGRATACRTRLAELCSLGRRIRTAAHEPFKGAALALEAVEQLDGRESDARRASAPPVCRDKREARERER